MTDTSSEATTPELREVEVDGRLVKLRSPNEIQIALITNRVKVAERSGERMKMLELMGEILDIIGTLIVDPDDHDHVESAMRAGRMNAEKAAEMFGASLNLSVPAEEPPAKGARRAPAAGGKTRAARR